MPNPTSSHYDPAVGAESLRSIDGPSAWRGENLRDPAQWCYTFSAAELDELESALRAVRKRGWDLLEIGPAEFALPRLAAVLADVLDTILNGRGFVLLRGLPLGALSRADAATIYWGLGAHLGNPRSQGAKGHVLGHIRSLGGDVDDPAVRIYQTTSRQTYHTDSCDVVGLLCLQKAKSGGLSSLASSTTVYNEMVKVRPDLATLLFRPIATDRRGEVPEGMAPYFTIPVFNEHEGRLSTIYQRQYIKSAQRFAEVPRFTEADIEALDLFDALAEDPRLHLDMAFEPGDMQFLCNHTMLHDRTGYEEWPEPERRRHLLRLWLAPRACRPLPPVYAERYGSVEVGNRGGIYLPGTRHQVSLEAE